MDNKLSELSKPVAEVVSKFGDLEAFGEREIKLLTGIQQMAYGTKFYSQEYVSTLLAELEAKDKRIADLEAGLLNSHHRLINTTQNCSEWERKAISNFEECATMSQCIEELQKRLATPVRLPPLMDGELCGKYGAKYGAAANAHNNAITACSIAIRGAGFKSEATPIRAAGFTVEGDE